MLDHLLVKSSWEGKSPVSKGCPAALHEDDRRSGVVRNGEAVVGTMRLMSGTLCAQPWRHVTVEDFLDIKHASAPKHNEVL